jgi:hypothetical protein
VRISELFNTHIAPILKQGCNSKSKIKKITHKGYKTREFSFLCLSIFNYCIVIVSGVKLSISIILLFRGAGWPRGQCVSALRSRMLSNVGQSLDG